ncbi:MAG TPA: hypothetical protein DIC60_09760 [Lachnospiraceae bacterium]|nr:hypothetical protein [Lachnospiraceae bacterium]
MITFIYYGLIGFIMEVLWTGLGSFINGDLTMKSTTSIWMFFIYGLAVFLQPLFILLEGLPIVLRGMIYMVLIFSAEYATGYLLERSIGRCPWDYGNGNFSIYGLIRLDYAPVWFVVGIFYEYIYFTII